MEAVEAARGLLARLISFTTACGPSSTATAWNHAMQHVHNVQLLNLHNLTAANVDGLALLAIVLASSGGLTSLALTCAAKEIVPLGAFALRVTNSCGKLQSLTIEGNDCMSESTVLEVATLCPNLCSASVRLSASGLTESTAVSLVQKWPRLERFSDSLQFSYTDAVIHALAEHCPHIRWLNLSRRSTPLTRCIHVDLIVVRGQLSKEVRQRIEQAAVRARKGTPWELFERS